jgi:predicted TPR repeat methyltransferase
MVLGMIGAAQGDWSGAVASVARGMAPQSTPRQILSELAGKLMKIALHERALECFRRMLEQDPNDVGALHFIASLSGQNPDHPDEEYVRRLFDQYAETFDRDLQASLGYTVPRDMVAELRAVCADAAPWDVLDLGCGTGLVGREIAAHSRQLVGVDLSPKMIERARHSKVYTELRTADLMSVVEEEPPDSYDVITAADVLLYVGKLDSLVAAISRTLRPGGMFAFSTEAAEFSPNAAANVVDGGYRLTSSGRYAHTESYLRNLALHNAFEIKVLRKVRLRTELRRPLMGWLSIWSTSDQLPP